MNKPCLLFTALFLLVFTSCDQQSGQTKNNLQKPNIVFLFTDDHAIQAISAYGSKINKTPSLDRLADEGMLFKNAMVTNSICAPSRAVILTGMHSHKNGVLDNRLEFDGSQITFPKLFQQNGYQTAIYGKWHLKSDPTGFDDWMVLPGQGNYYNPDFKTPDGRKQIEGYVTDIVTDLTIDWLENKRDTTKPFLIMSQHKAPHRKWLPGPDHLTTYDDVVMPEPPTLFDDYEHRASGAKNQEMEIGEHMDMIFDLKVTELLDSSDLDQYGKYRLTMFDRLNEEQWRNWRKAYEPKNKAFLESNLKGDELVRWKYQRYIKDYLRTIASVDDNIGRILNYLEEAGLAENTVVVYSSDQGFYLGEHGWFDKRWMYEESLHTPLIIRWPGVVKQGSINTSLVQNLDYAETFLDIAGIEIPGNMQGESLVPVLKGTTPDNWRKSVYYHYYEFPGAHSVPRHYGVRNDRYKLIYYYQLNEWELFDLEKDPHELNSVYDNPEYTDHLNEMKKELIRLREYYQDTTGTDLNI